MLWNTEKRSFAFLQSRVEISSTEWTPRPVTQRASLLCCIRHKLVFTHYHIADHFCVFLQNNGMWLVDWPFTKIPRGCTNLSMASWHQLIVWSLSGFTMVSQSCGAEHCNTEEPRPEETKHPPANHPTLHHDKCCAAHCCCSLQLDANTCWSCDLLCSQHHASGQRWHLTQLTAQRFNPDICLPWKQAHFEILTLLPNYRYN